jgi:pimeloyl-ACP methyl ester carboxylesterase
MPMSRSRRYALAGVAVLLVLAGKWYSGRESRPAAGHDGAAASADAAPAPRLRLGGIEFTPCALSAEGARESVNAQCARFEVPENHDAPTGRRIELAVAWVPASGEAAPDPVVFIAGGPGQSALQAYPQIADAFADVRRNRHVILVDARGTGGSHPLACRDRHGNSAVMEEGEDTAAQARAFAERCLAQLDRDSDLRYYTTEDHIRDLDAVRAAIGAPQLNLIGGSYGTRVAQQYAKRFPAHTRTVTLDSVVPATLVLGSEHALNLEAALDAQFARCRELPACLERMGDPRRNLERVRERLQSNALPPVRYRDPTSGEWREEAPRYGHLAMLLRMYAYSPQTASLLPQILHEAAQGRFEAMLAQSRMLQGTLGEAIMHGMQLSVMCGEDGPELRVDPADAGRVLGDDLLELTLAQCAVWPRRERPADFREPLRGDLPVLILSGEFDPVTPPRYGETVLYGDAGGEAGRTPLLANGRHLVLPGQGHSVVQIGCMPKLFAQFVENADARSLDAACLQRLAATPPFAGDYGWEP